MIKGYELLVNEVDDSTDLKYSQLRSNSISLRSKKRKHLLLLLILITIIVCVGNNVLFYKISLPMKNYPLFLMFICRVLLMPVYWTVLTVWLIVYTMKRKNHRNQSGIITSSPPSTDVPESCYEEDKIEGLDLSKWKIALISFLDSSQNLLAFYSDSHVPGPMQQLIIQMVVPFSILLSVVFLRAHYSGPQYIGAFVIIAGIVLDILPSLTNSATWSTISTWWILIYLSSTIPFALSTVFKEHNIKALSVNALYLQAWNNTFQALFCVLFIPLSLVEDVNFQSLSLDSVLSSISVGMTRKFLDGGKCFLGENTLPDDNCEGFFLVLLLFLFFNVSINLCMLAMLWLDSSTFMFLALTLAIPLANMCFTFAFIMGSYVQPLNALDIVSMMIILSGLLLYQFGSLIFQWMRAWIISSPLY